MILCLALGCSSPAGDTGADAGALPEIDRERSLVWIDPMIVDDPAIVGLGRVMAAVAADGHGGVLLRDWLESFATTAHSERLGPALLIEELEQTFGADARAWDVDALPFMVTAVHNRIDLGPRDGDCGELRVSVASTHPIYAPLHLIFLFEQPGDGDGCRTTAQRWARLSALEGAELVAAASAILGEHLVRERFVLAESVELTVSPWEWRQWTLDGAPANPPLFQTADTARLNQPGALRDRFVAFARDNAAGLAAREVEIPVEFRAASARVPPGVERERLELAIDGYPELAAAVEIVGCPACHTENAEFVHTSVERTFSDFYDLELDARASWLAATAAGRDAGVPPFGPLQER